MKKGMVVVGGIGGILLLSLSISLTVLTLREEDIQMGLTVSKQKTPSNPSVPSIPFGNYGSSNPSDGNYGTYDGDDTEWKDEWSGLYGYEGPFPTCSSPTFKNEIFATMLLTNNYLPSLLKLYCSMKQVKTTRPLVVFYDSTTISEESLDILYSHGIEAQPIELMFISNKFIDRFSINWTKLRFWKMEQYSKIIYLDSDMFLLQNIDHLFDLPNTFAIPADTDRHACGGPMGFNQAGLFVLQPCESIYHDMMSLVTSDPKYQFQYSDAEQGFLNFYFQFNRILLPPDYNFLAHNKWNTGLRDNAKVIHYTAYKPFQSKDGEYFPWFQPWLDCQLENIEDEL